MRNRRVDLTRRQYLAAGAGLVAAGLGGVRPAFALETVPNVSPTVSLV